jgi:hypothetical protein
MGFPKNYYDLKNINEVVKWKKIIILV